MNETEACWYQQYVVDEMNRFYDENIVGHEVQPHFKPMTDLLDLCEKGTPLLDLGCGTAFSSQICKDFEYEGADLPHVLSGCSMRNFPHFKYRACDIVEDNLAWIRPYDVILLNGVIDICSEGLYILRRIMTHASRYILVHRQEITEKGQTRSIVNGSYGGKTFHSIISRSDLMDLCDEMGFDLIKETSPGFPNWENGGSSFLLLNREYKSGEKKKYESHPLRQLRNRIQQTEPRKIIVGAGDVRRPVDWICSNEEELNVESRSDWEFLFGDTKADRILGEHLFEHLRFPEVAIKNIYDFLRPEGTVLLAVPDGYFPDPRYIDDVRPGGRGSGSDDHVHLWDYKTFSKLLKDAGFEVNVWEHFDENGRFHEFQWPVEMGYIGRSRRNDERNTETEIKYTSLIISGTKPC